MFCGSGGSKSRLVKAAGAEPAGRVREMKNCTQLRREANVQVYMHKHLRVRAILEVAMWKRRTPLRREAHLEVKIVKARRVLSIFGICDVEKVHVVVAQGTFGSQECQKHTRLGYFW